MGNLCGGQQSATVRASASRSDFLKYTASLKNKVKAQFKDNPSVKFIESGSEIIESDGIPFEVRLITSLAKKPTLKDQSANQNAAKKPFDPFMPPFEPGLYID